MVYPVFPDLWPDKLSRYWWTGNSLEKLFFPSANAAPEPTCEELSEEAQPVVILFYSLALMMRNRGWADPGESFKCSDFGGISDSLDAVTGSVSGMICSVLSRHLWETPQFWAHVG